MKYKIKFSVWLLIGGLIIYSSCATIFRGTQQSVNFSSDPPGAEVFVMGQSTGRVTPCDVKVKRKVHKNIYKNNQQYEQIYELKKDGYHDFLTKDYGNFNYGSFYLWVWDIGTYGIGTVIDIVNGAFRVYSGRIYGQLVSKGGNPDNYTVKSNNEKSNLNEKPNYSAQNSPAEIFDVDKNIPVAPKKNPYRFALVIGNEDYSSFQKDLNSEMNVAFAVNDASVFKEYCVKTLGIPEENVTLLLNAKAMEMNRAIKKINLLAKNSAGKAEIIFYYAGHGFPDEVSKEPYLMPVDVSGAELDFAIKLNELYRQLTEYPAQKITVFLDACFSGGARNQGLLAARGVKIKPKEDPLNNGKMIVFAASSGDQSSLPYKEKKHGIFTYFLLKKFMDTKGQMTYKELSDYLAEQVGLKSVMINNKEQNPQTNVSSEAKDVWTIWSFK
ncbi:MAG: caspase family protein [Bacteroidia bacterium]|nr:caspase family protein [Bacteroidia bacterium]